MSDEPGAGQRPDEPPASGRARPPGDPPAWGDPPAEGRAQPVGGSPRWVGGAPPPGGPWTGGRPRVRRLNLADVLDGMFRVLLRHWRTYMVALGVVLVPVNIVLAYLSYRASRGIGLLQSITNPTSLQQTFADGLDVAALAALYAVSLVSALLVTPYVEGLACLIAADDTEGGQPEPAGVLRRVLSRYWPLVASTLLLFAILAVLFLPAIVVLAVAAAAESASLAWLGALLAVGAVAAAIACYVRFSLAYPVVIVDGVGPATALRRSWGLVSGRFWGVLGILLLVGLIAGIIGNVLAAPFAFGGGLVGGRVGLVLTAVGGVVAGIVASPLTANARTLLYYDGRVRHEALDVEVLAGAVEEGLPRRPDDSGAWPG